MFLDRHELFEIMKTNLLSKDLFISTNAAFYLTNQIDQITCMNLNQAMTATELIVCANDYPCGEISNNDLIKSTESVIFPNNHGIIDEQNSSFSILVNYTIYIILFFITIFYF